MGIKHTHTGRRLEDVSPVFLDASAEKSLALTALALIRQRTFTRGVGIDGRALPAYTPSYAAQRAREGRRASPPDYTRTGRLRRSVRSVSRRRGARVRITLGAVGQRAIVAAVLNRRGAGWLGLSPDDKSKFGRALTRAIASTRARQGAR